MGRCDKLWLEAGLPLPGDPAFSLRFWCVEAGYNLSPGCGLLAHAVTAHCALWRWSVAMACSHMVEEGGASGAQDMHDCGNDEFVVPGSYLVLHSFNQLIQICRNRRRFLLCICGICRRFEYGFHRPYPWFVTVVMCCG